MVSDTMSHAAADRYAWIEPDVEDLGAGVYRIPLPLPMDGLKAVNVYAITDPGGVDLIDAGVGSGFPGRSSADGSIPEFPEFRDTARSSRASRSASSVTWAASSAFRVSRTSISTPWISASTARSSSGATADTPAIIPAASTRRHQTPCLSRNRNLSQHKPIAD